MGSACSELDQAPQSTAQRVGSRRCFSPGETDYFQVQVPLIGELEALSLRLPRATKRRAWVVESLTVEEDTPAPLLWHVPLGARLSGLERVEHKLKSGRRAVVYRVDIYTGTKGGGMCGEVVDLCLDGEHGSSGPVRLYAKGKVHSVHASLELGHRHLVYPLCL